MSRNYYSEINLHLTWHTLLSKPLLNARLEPLAHRELRQKIVNWPGAFVHAIGGIETHVHLAVTIAPTILISDFVGQIKGATAHAVNQAIGHKILEWQTGYGVVSFGMRDLDWVNAYIRDQKEHHARGTVHDRLERITAMEDDCQAQAAQREAP